MTTDTTELCQAPAPNGHCNRPARHYIGWQGPDGTTHWGHVCGNHDNMFGVANLVRNLGLDHVAAWTLNLRLLKAGRH